MDDSQPASTRAVVDAYLERYNDHDLPGLMALFAPMVAHEDDLHPRATLQSAFDAWTTGFPDLELVVDRLIVDGEEAAVAVTVSGTHEGLFLGLEPTGATIEVDEVLLLTVEDGAITSFDVVWDQLGLFVDLGTLEHPLG